MGIIFSLDLLAVLDKNFSEFPKLLSTNDMFFRKGSADVKISFDDFFALNGGISSDFISENSVYLFEFGCLLLLYRIYSNGNSFTFRANPLL